MKRSKQSATVKHSCIRDFSAKLCDTNWICKLVTDVFLSSEHVNHIRAVAGEDHVGLGAGFDGINL